INAKYFDKSLQDKGFNKKIMLSICNKAEKWVWLSTEENMLVTVCEHLIMITKKIKKNSLD
ncbi:TPA: hypothetical protein ACF54O_002653, partial [Legionella pneumophila]